MSIYELSLRSKSVTELKDGQKAVKVVNEKYIFFAGEKFAWTIDRCSISILHSSVCDVSCKSVG